MVGLGRGVDGDQHAVVAAAALKDQLRRLDKDVAVAARAQGRAGGARPGQGGDPGGQLILFRLLDGRAQGGVAVLFLAGHPPFAAIVDGRDAGHAEQKAVERFEVFFVRKDAGNAGDVVVVGKIEQRFAGVQAPGLRAELTVEAVGDLVHVERVEAGIQALVTFVVCDRMAGVVVHPAVIVAVQRLAHQNKIRLELVCKVAQRGEEIKVKAVGDVEAQAVDVVIAHPGGDGIEDMFTHGGVVQVELDKLVAALPAFVPEAVVIVGVAVKAQVEPVFIGAVPAFFLYVSERPEAAADMVEHAVQHDLEPGGVQSLADSLEVVRIAQAAVNLVKIARVVAVGVAFKQRIEQHAGRAERFDMVDPAEHAAQAVRLDAVVLQRRAAQAQRVDLIENSVLIPHSLSFLLLFWCLPDQGAGGRRFLRRRRR